MANSYEIGAEVTVRCEFTNAAGAAADPTAVTLKVKNPDGTVTTYTTDDLTNDQVGRWEYSIDVADSGRYAYKFTGTGAVKAAAAGYFIADEDVFETDVVAV